MFDYNPQLRMFSVASSFFIGKNTILFLSKRQYRLYSGKVILYSHISKVKHIFNLNRSYWMVMFVNIIIMYSSMIMVCFVQYSTFTVYHILCLYSMLLLFTRVVAFSLSPVLWSWNLLFSSI